MKHLVTLCVVTALAALLTMLVYELLRQRAEVERLRGYSRWLVATLNHVGANPPGENPYLSESYRQRVLAATQIVQ